MIERTQIANLIPHAGDMCLLERVMAWDASSICCTTASHLLPDHPLAVNGKLNSACGVEYAAQAMAVHGALAGANNDRPQRGYLVSVRALIVTVPRLDTLQGALIVEATRLAGEGSQMSYRFILRSAGLTVLQGRAAVVLDAALS